MFIQLPAAWGKSTALAKIHGQQNTSHTDCSYWARWFIQKPAEPGVQYPLFSEFSKVCGKVCESYIMLGIILLLINLFSKHRFFNNYQEYNLYPFMRGSILTVWKYQVTQQGKFLIALPSITIWLMNRNETVLFHRWHVHKKLKKLESFTKVKVKLHNLLSGREKLC